MRHERPSREDLEAFETAYNAACLNIAKGEFAQGEVLLNRAKSRDPAGYSTSSMLIEVSVQTFVKQRRNSRPKIERRSCCQLPYSIFMS